MSASKPNTISHINVWYLRDDDASISDEELRSLILSQNPSLTDETLTIVAQSKSMVESEWEPKKGDFYTAVHDKVNTYNRFEAFVVATAPSSSKLFAMIDGEIMYALYEKKVPVLQLFLEKNSPVRSHKLLTVCQNYESVENQKQAVKNFFTFPATAGRVIVVEGGDGAGKQTQVKMLVDRLRSENFPVETLDYPHDSAGYGVLIRELLSGKMGNIREVNPLIFAALYGLNRHSTLPLLKYWIQRGKNILLDRYMTANFGHQASKYEKDEERIAAINTLRAFELKWLNLPDADKVFYLNLPPDFAFRAMQQDTTRRELDMHELAGIEYKNNVRKSFLWCCSTFSETWTEVPCVNNYVEGGKMASADNDTATRFTREEVHKNIYEHVAPLLVNKAQ